MSESHVDFGVEDALMRRLFNEPLPYSGRFIENPYTCELFSPLNNALKYASDNFLCYYPHGGGNTLRLSLNTRFRPTEDLPCLVLDLPYDKITIEQRILEDGQKTNQVCIKAPPYLISTHIIGRNYQELIDQLLNREIYAAYDPGCVLSPFDGDERWFELPEPKLVSICIDPLYPENIKSALNDWSALTEDLPQ